MGRTKDLFMQRIQEEHNDTDYDYEQYQQSDSR